MILAGGAALRMGGVCKGLEQVGGRRIIDRVARALAGATDALLIAANDPAADAWLPGVPVVRDTRPGFGALSGIHAALEHTATDVLAVAWDMPFVPESLLRAVRDAGELHEGGMAAAASRSPWGFEPLAAWYAAETLPRVTTMLDAGDARVGAVGDHATRLAVDVSSWGDPDEIFLSVNTPDDLARARAIATRGPL